MQHHQIHVLFYFFSFSLVILDFPIPGKETIPSTTDTISIFHRPIESSIPKEEEEKKESEESEEEEVESDDEEVSIGSKMCFDQLGQVIKNFEKKKTIQNLIN